ncbi:unnamed protein product [Lactuca saligna]|uniref:Uncharacterized protein n=1 Tax=Lactuca saligna TaxID=75948 RepID=A0AA35YPA6_LACSI|nr:unnamed protein product [Lactuca saligna]
MGIKLPTLPLNSYKPNTSFPAELSFIGYWSPNYHRHMDENHSNGVTNEDMAINLLQTQLELSLIREDFQDELPELRRIVNRDLDAMNREVDDVRASQLDISNVVADLKNHFVSLQ